MSRLITILIVILIIVIIAAGAIVWLLPSQPPSTTTPSSTAEPLFADDTLPPSPTPGAANGRIFNVEVLRSTLYQSLNHQLIDSGALPVQPPAAIGKANPFL